MWRECSRITYTYLAISCKINGICSNSLVAPFLFKPCESSASVGHFKPGWGDSGLGSVGGGKQARSERQTCYDGCRLVAA